MSLMSYITRDIIAIQEAYYFQLILLGASNLFFFSSLSQMNVFHCAYTVLLNLQEMS